MIPKRRFLVFGLWISNEHGAVTLASALASAGFQSPDVSPKRRWFRRGWHVAAASRVDPDVTQATVSGVRRPPGRERICLDCGRRTPQLKRNPLGGTTRDLCNES
jgi:hypothetical protein